MSSSDRDTGGTGQPAPLSLAIPAGGRGASGTPNAFSVDEFTGAARLEIPIASSVPRRLAPDLTLSYSSNAGNGPVGVGFSLPLPTVSRYTGEGVPRYESTDTFVLGGSQVLVPLREGPERVETQGAEYDVTRYAPRVAATRELIERWVRASDGDTVWRHVDAAGLTSVFGLSADARIFDPANPWRVFEWLLQAQYDRYGEAISYEYLPEDGAGLTQASWEAGRDHSAQRYLGFVRYAPQSAVSTPPYGIGPPPNVSWHAEVVLDYGQYDCDPSKPSPYAPTGTWIGRPDPFSRYEAGFEIRTHRRLANLMLFHRFDQLGSEPMLTHVTRLTYEDSPVASRLVRYDSIGCKDGEFAPLPSLELDYTPLTVPGGPFQPLAPPPGGERLPGIADPPAYTFADLDGQGLPSLLYADGESVLSWPPNGQATPFGLGGPLAAFPIERVASDTGIQLRDVTCDGFDDMLVTQPRRSGLYAYENGEFQRFQPFAEAASELWSGTGALVDLSGDGLPDVVVLERGEVRRYPGMGAAGWAAPTSVPAPPGAPATLYGGEQALIAFADVLGGGAAQLVRVSNGAVECWPSLGYGALGERVTLGGAPYVGEQFDPRRVLLVDIDDTGAADIVYVMSDRVLVYVNQSGNSFAEPIVVALPLTVGAADQVTVVELPLGGGTQSLLVTSPSPEPQHWICPLSREAKPYLLRSLRNGLGAETEIAYERSANYWLADQAVGIPWLSTLPFEVPVVASVREHDLVSDTTSTATYRYRHGHYSPRDREYGFLLVDRWDAELLDPASEALAPDRRAAASQPTSAARDEPSPQRNTPSPQRQSGARVPRTRAQIERDAQSAAPRQTRTWRSPGELPDATLQAALSAEWFQGDPLACTLAGPTIEWNGPVPNDGETVSQAYAALRGRATRTEIYGPDGTDRAEIPYRVSQTAHEVALVQPREAGPFAAFMTHESQTLDYLYERDSNDPTIQHWLSLDIDRYGQVLKACSIAYPRRAAETEPQPHESSLDTGADASPGALSPPAQSAMLAVLDTFGYVDIDVGEMFRVGIPYEHRGRQLTGLPLPNAGCCYTPAEVAELVKRALAGEDGLSAMTIEWRRCLYYGPDGVTPAELGQSGVQALMVCERLAAFADSEIRGLFASVMEPSALTALLEEGRYVLDVASATWWAPGPSDTYLRTSGFCRPSSTIDPCGASIAYTYDATTVALVETVEHAADTLERAVSTQAFDYFALQPLAVRDVNETVSEVTLDPLAQVCVSSFHGSELGEPVGFAEIVAKRWPQAPDAATLIAEPTTYLDDAGQVSLYDLLAWTGHVSATELQALGVDGGALLATLAQAGYTTPEGILLNAFRQLSGPAALDLPEPFAGHANAIYALLDGLPSGVPAYWAIVSARDYPDRPRQAPEIAVDYMDGLGRVVQRKQQASPAATSDGWITSGAVRYNSRGQPYARCEPFFSDDWSFVAEALIADMASATICTYDPLDRVVRVDVPEGFFAAFEIAAWSLTTHDEIDTVTESSYWHEHSNGQGIGPRQLQALRQAALSAGTPTTVRLDGLGNAIAKVELLNRTIAADALEALGIDRATAQELYGELRANAMLDFRGALTTAFQPAQVGFSLGLSADLAYLEARVVALLKSLLCTGTPLVSGYGRDVLGRQLWSRDPRLTESGEAMSFQTTYSLTGEILLAVSADAGVRLRLPDAAGQELLMFDARGIAIATRYDALGRPLAVSVAQPGGKSAQTVEVYVYGDQLVDGQPVVPDPQACNLMGEVYRMFDLAGMREIDGYSLGGMPMVMAQRFLADPYAEPDWTPAQATPFSPLLADETWRSSRTYDAGGRLVAVCDAVGDTYTWTHTQLGFPRSVAMALAGGEAVAYLNDVQYNAQGQRTLVTYANGTHIEYSYDPLSFRLTRTHATQGPNGPTIADLRYTYDPIGNLTYVEDSGFTALFGDANGSPDRAYLYDSLYRLVSATAPEPPLYSPREEREAGYEGLALATTDGELPPGSLSRATRNHAYDPAGNLYWTERASDGSDRTEPTDDAASGTGADDTQSWTSETILSPLSNRGVSAALLGLTPAPPGDAPAERTAPAAEIDRFFDADGNQTTVEKTPIATFDYADRLARATVALPDGGEGSVLRAHDALNQLMRELQTTPPPDGQTLDALHLDALELVRTSSPSGKSVSSQRVVVRDGRALVAEVLTDDGTDDATVAYALSDPTGSVTVRLGEQGELLSYEAYTPYGATAFAVMGSAAETHDKLERFDGRVRDRLTGGYAFERRDYAPWLGRWLSPDPTGPIDGLNLFAFVGCNPTSYTDVGGRIKIEVADGTTIDIQPDDILAAIYQAISNIERQAVADPIQPTGTARKMDQYEARQRGDLLRLAFDTTRRGDPLTGLAVASYALKFGTLDITEKALGGEVGVHGTVIVGNAVRPSMGMVGYADIDPTADERAEAKRLIHLFKVKTVPLGNDPNDAIVPVMAISETDRSLGGGVLALMGLYLVKKGLATFKEVFYNDNDPLYFPAKSKGGAKGSKGMERRQRALALKIDFKKTKGPRITRSQTTKRDLLLEKILLSMHTHRGGDKQSLFANATRPSDVTNAFRVKLEKRLRLENRRKASTRVLRSQK